MKPNNTISYQKTIYACFLGYISQAAAVNFVPLLFVTFQKQYNIPLTKITALITVCFVLQLIVDFASAFFIDKIGYRASALSANIFVAVGFISLTFLPEMLPDPFIGLLISVLLYAIGSGLIEVVISPIVESCPSEHKSKTMSLLHSFYCWGSVGVVVISTLFFWIFGIENWKVLAAVWAILPIFNAFLFINTPIVDLEQENGKQLSLGELLKNKLFWTFFIIMICAGASEQAISQWSSAFVEKALNISKTYGDLVGPAIFAFFMGTSRTIYGKIGEKLNLNRMIFICSLLCVGSYLFISLSPSPILSLMGIGLCGFSVGIMWPGTFSMTSASIKGGNAMFSLLALAGDLGCTCGPTFVGFIAGITQDNLKLGILAAIIFPIILISLLILKYGMQGKLKKKPNNTSLSNKIK